MKRHSHIAAVYMIMRLPDGTFPMLLRQNTGYRDGQYIVPSGHVERGEHISQAVIRELQEEVGVEVGIDDFHLVHFAHRLVDDSEEDRVDLFFEVERWQGEITNCEPDKCLSVDYFTETTLPSNTYDYFVKVCQHIREGKIFSEF